MYRPIGLLVLAVGSVFLPTAQADVVVQTSLSLTSLQINPSFGVTEILSPFSASAAIVGEDSLSGPGTCPQFSQVNDGSTGLISCASALQGASGSASSLGDLTSSLAATAANSINIGEVTASASNSSAGGLGGDLGGTGLFEIYDASDPAPSSVSVTFTASLSGNQSLATDVYGQSAASEIIFNLFLPDIGTTVLFLDNPLSIGPSSSLSAACCSTQTGTVTLQTNTDYTLIAEVDAESSGYNLTPEPSSFFLTALGLFTALYAGWRFKRESRKAA